MLYEADLNSYLQQASLPGTELPKLLGRDAVVTIFDIGACEGEDSIRYSRLFPRGRIFAFEPLPENQALIMNNFRDYEVKNAELFPLALSNNCGSTEFHVSSGTPGYLSAGANWNYGNKSSSLLPPANDEPMQGWIEFKQTIAVQVQTIDQFCAERQVDHIDFIHMDVQGAELLVLEGAACMLPRITALWLEVSEKPLYRGQVLRPEVEALMKKEGFILALEELGEVQGDQLYLNRRYWKSWAYLAKRKARSIGSKIKRKLAGIKRRLIAPRMD